MADPFLPALFNMPAGTVAGSRTVDPGEMRGARFRAQEAPFIPRDFPLPRKVWQAVPALVIANLLLTTLAGVPQPVRARTFDLPTFRQSTDTGEIFSRERTVNPQSPALAPLFPLPPRSFVPLDFRQSNLLETTLKPPVGLQLPFNSFKFDVPSKNWNDPGEIIERPSTVTPPVVSATPFAPVIWDMPQYKVTARTSSMLRPSPEDQIFPGQADFWSLPPLYFKRVDFAWPNLLATTLAPLPTVPFVQYNWNLPAKYFRATDFAWPNLNGTTLAPPFVPPTAENKYPLPPYRIAYPSSEWIPNLLEGTLGLPPNLKPFGEQSFPLPYYALQRIEQKGWLSTIPPDRLPPGPPPIVVTTDQSTPGRIRHDWWKSKEEVESKRLKEKAKRLADSGIETDALFEEGERLAEVLAESRSKTEAVQKKSIALEALLGEEGVKRPVAERADLERQALVAKQELTMLAAQESMLMEEMEMNDILYIARIAMEL